MEAIDEAEPRTPVERDLEREIEGVLKAHLSGETGIQMQVIVSGPTSDENTGTSIEVDGSEGSDVEVVNGREVDEIVEQTGVKLEEAGTGIVLIGKLCAIGGTDTEGLRLSGGDSCEAKDRNCDGDKLFHF